MASILTRSRRASLPISPVKMAVPATPATPTMILRRARRERACQRLPSLSKLLIPRDQPYVTKNLLRYSYTDLLPEIDVAHGACTSLVVVAAFTSGNMEGYIAY